MNKHKLSFSPKLDESSYSHECLLELNQTQKTSPHIYKHQRLGPSSLNWNKRVWCHVMLSWQRPIQMQAWELAKRRVTMGQKAMASNHNTKQTKVSTHGNINWSHWPRGILLHHLQVTPKNPISYNKYLYIIFIYFIP